MIGELMSAVLARFFGGFNGRLKISVLQVFQYFAEVAGRPVFVAVFVEATYPPTTPIPPSTNRANAQCPKNAHYLPPKVEKWSAAA